MIWYSNDLNFSKRWNKQNFKNYYFQTIATCAKAIVLERARTLSALIAEGGTGGAHPRQKVAGGVRCPEIGEAEGAVLGRDALAGAPHLAPALRGNTAPAWAAPVPASHLAPPARLGKGHLSGAPTRLPRNLLSAPRRSWLWMTGWQKR